MHIIFLQRVVKKKSATVWLSSPTLHIAQRLSWCLNTRLFWVSFCVTSSGHKPELRGMLTNFDHHGYHYSPLYHIPDLWERRRDEKFEIGYITSLQRPYRAGPEAGYPRWNEVTDGSHFIDPGWPEGSIPGTWWVTPTSSNRCLHTRVYFHKVSSGFKSGMYFLHPS